MKFDEIIELEDEVVSKKVMFDIMKSECCVWLECTGESGFYKNRLVYDVEIKEGEIVEHVVIYTEL